MTPVLQSRRRFLRSAAALTALQTYISPSQLFARSRRTHISSELAIAIHVNEVITRIPHDLLGLSYESSQLAAEDFFSIANTELISFFRKLSPCGVLRLGGNLSEYTVWTPDEPDRPIPLIPFRAVGADQNTKTAISPAAVTPQSIRNLDGFLYATGWRAVYGLNLALAKRARVVAESKFVAATLGDKLIAFQIGNEPDHYVMNGLRPPGYTFDQYFSEWSTLHTDIQNALPQACFAGPDIAEDIEWLSAFAAKAPSGVSVLTGHHYAEGPPANPSMTLERLLAPDAGLDSHLERIGTIADRAYIPYCMAETNSCFSAGKEGVSNVFGSALWAIDYTMQLARARERGVYFHGGANSWYTPIAGGSGEPFRARPIYSGLLLCRELLGCEMVRVTMPSTDLNLAAYAFRQPNRLLIINKDRRKVTFDLADNLRATGVLWLGASSPQATVGITIGSSPLDAVLQHNLSFEHLTPLAQLTIPAFTAGLFDLTD